MTEYASKQTGNYNAQDYTVAINNVSRYACNNIISDTTAANSINTYKKLYSLYSTTSDSAKPTLRVTDALLGGISSTDNCINGCPHTVATGTTATPNVLAASSDNRVNVSDLAFYLDDCGSRIRDYSNKSKTYGYDLNNATILRDVSYANLINTRNDLDNKMNEILGNNKNSILFEKQNELDASVYSTLLWTVMVTSLIYYVFTKI